MNVDVTKIWYDYIEQIMDDNFFQNDEKKQKWQLNFGLLEKMGQWFRSLATFPEKSEFGSHPLSKVRGSHIHQ